MPLLVDAIRASANGSARYDSDSDVRMLVKRPHGPLNLAAYGPWVPIGQFVSDSEESYAGSVQYDDARPVETYDAENLAATLDVLRSLRLPGLVPQSACWQPADVIVDQWTHSA